MAEYVVDDESKVEKTAPYGLTVCTADCLSSILFKELKSLLAYHLVIYLLKFIACHRPDKSLLMIS